ncbi:MAG TPA: hypothetical protein VES93_11025 [Ornithinibacter sp.]|nr:hypothetical protein [Ornithinibacter sp.]
MNHEEAFSVSDAAVVLDDSERRAAQALDVRTDALLAAWGAAVVVGHVGIWWGVRGQDPYTGPPGWSLAVLGVLLLVALVTTVVVIYRATAGVTGSSASMGRAYSLAWGLSFTAYWALLMGLARLDAAPEVVSLVSSVVPLLLVSTIYLAGSTLWGRSASSGVVTGALLAATAFTASWFDPARLALVIALGAGIAFGAGVVIARRSR